VAQITLSGIELTVTRRPFATASHRPMDVIMKDDSQPEISAQEKGFSSFIVADSISQLNPSLQRICDVRPAPRLMPMRAGCNR
jgi:hypothetical protein